MQDRNQKDCVIKFYPSKRQWSKQLSGIENFYSNFFTRGALYFEGQIDVEKFRLAMQSTLDEFDFTFSQIKRNSLGSTASYTAELEQKNSHAIPLTLNYRYQSIHTVDEKGALPAEILEGQSMGAFKLTIGKDGFAIGYILNHAFFDQASTVYFFKYLSAIYSQDSIIKPVLGVLNESSSDEIVRFDGIGALHSYGKSLGLSAISNKERLLDKLVNPCAEVSVELSFNAQRFTALKSDSPQFITDNDIIHAILFKIHAMNPALCADNQIHLMFPVNMRKRCGLGEEAIGNLQTVYCVNINIDFVRRASLLELAQFNRNFVAQINSAKFYQDIHWYDNFFQLGEKVADYCLMPMDDIYCRGISNWTSFHYQDIAFDGVSPTALKTPSLAGYGFSIVCFDNKRHDEQLNLSIAVLPSLVNEVIQLEQRTNLFRTKILSCPKALQLIVRPTLAEPAQHLRTAPQDSSVILRI